MLSKQNRLTKTREIERVMKMGRSFGTPLLGVKALASENPTTRIAVVAGLSASKRAVLRNRAKRLIREALRKNLRAVVSGADVVVTARAAIVGKTYEEVEDSLGFALRKLGLLR